MELNPTHLSHETTWLIIRLPALPQVHQIVHKCRVVHRIISRLADIISSSKRPHKSFGNFLFHCNDLNSDLIATFYNFFQKFINTSSSYFHLSFSSFTHPHAHTQTHSHAHLHTHWVHSQTLFSPKNAVSRFLFKGGDSKCQLLVKTFPAPIGRETETWNPTRQVWTSLEQQLLKLSDILNWM